MYSQISPTCCHALFSWHLTSLSVEHSTCFYNLSTLSLIFFLQVYDITWAVSLTTYKLFIDTSVPTEHLHLGACHFNTFLTTSVKHYWHLLAEFTNTCVWTTSLLLPNLAISVAQIKQLLWNVQLVHMLHQGALNVNHVPKELHVQPKGFLHMYYVQMELTQMLKVWVIVKCVQLASSVQVLEWKHQKNVLMEHTVTQLVLDIVFCVQRVIGEGLFIHKISLLKKKSCM